MENDLLSPENLRVPGDLTPETLKAIEEWTFPETIRRGDRIIFAPSVSDMQNPTTNRKWPGIVVRVDHRTVEIACFAGGLMPKTSCRHVTDPELVIRPHLIEEACTGVFRLADSEVEQRALAARLDNIESLLRPGYEAEEDEVVGNRTVIQRLDDLERAAHDDDHTDCMRTDTDEKPKKRGPGRPPKNKPAETAAV